MQSPFMFSAISRQERNLVTTFTFDCIHDAGGWVDDAQMFSNAMTNIRFSIPGDRLSNLIKALQLHGLKIDQNDATQNVSIETKTILRSGSLQIRFVHTEPDLKRTVPAVPGY